MSVIDDPIAAIAAGRCVLARSLATTHRPTTAQHPRRCAWCDYELADLARMVEGWNAWADGKDRGRATVYARHDAQLFAERSRRDPVEAERLIVEAQGLEDALEPGGGGIGSSTVAVGRGPQGSHEPGQSGSEISVVVVDGSAPAHDPEEVDVSAWM